MNILESKKGSASSPARGVLGVIEETPANQVVDTAYLMEATGIPMSDLLCVLDELERKRLLINDHGVYELV